MTEFLFPPPPIAAVPVSGKIGLFPVNRIFCVGRNYAAHAAEMGAEVDREAPFYFLKSPHAVLASGGSLAYPPGTRDLHHEVELVVALGAGGFALDRDQAPGLVWGYGTGLDMTRRDLQAQAKAAQRPWDLGKDFEGAAVLSALTPAAGFRPGAQPIRLSVNGALRQDGRLDDMVWGVADLIADLSRYYHLRPGDLIMTGTPAGVGAVLPGDRLRGEIAGLAAVELTIGPPDPAGATS
ncbi:MULTISPECIES: fumarylacetoacetate hydrolase family protein [unclassified Paracoccus (in: a-proteobacteria)]|uniref:fumarylacetoacetate hydrolase family protein n=1 Tax=unclassified Paracoccus (in: a-proteobacteria) TaxID=2688777 RepID=UPI0012B382D8|nr:MULTISPECIES: fumarylacetoacetate hydrolase family protein [unclassified Paracoccus (in: a-proteobacteria)]UXU75820.1 fumarylacetoacetate hydrolase family protein [Paracoccus sp. SMMA_5]UXU81729.1 fumarylacetoacetate hydrolase family protein [Paracoccus sp. SMMA_5_TC]